MTMGQRILQARLEAGLSQRELAGEEITRNMLSSLEHDTANPSLSTLRCLSERLGRPVSWFLGEDCGSEAAQSFARGEYRRCRELLRSGPESDWLEPLARLREAEEALSEGKIPYARSLLAELDYSRSPLFSPELRRKAALLSRECGLDAAIPDDGSLLQKARDALAAGNVPDARRYLLAQDDRGPEWDRLMGECAFTSGDYPEARRHFHRCEEVFDVRRRLEICCREMEDYKMAYYYAKQSQAPKTP